MCAEARLTATRANASRRLLPSYCATCGIAAPPACAPRYVYELVARGILVSPARPRRLPALVGSQAAATSLSSADPVSLVDPFVGTEGNGHTFPGADVPFGMVQFSPVSVGGGSGGYEFDDARLSGFSLRAAAPAARTMAMCR